MPLMPARVKYRKMHRGSRSGMASRGIDLSEIASQSMGWAARYEPVLGRGTTAPTHGAPMFTAHLARVAVDPETGQMVLAANGRASGSARFQGVELLGMRTEDLNRIRGSRIAMIFQDAMTSLNPYLRISRQMTEVLVTHRGIGESEARKAAVAMLTAIGRAGDTPAASSRRIVYHDGDVVAVQAKVRFTTLATISAHP